MSKLKLLLVSLFISIFASAQTIPNARTTDWSRAGLLNSIDSSILNVDLDAFGLVGDSLTVNDSLFQMALSMHAGDTVNFRFGAGKYLFNSTLELPNNFILSGMGPENTELIFDLGGSGNCIQIRGKQLKEDTFAILSDLIKDSTSAIVNNATDFAIGKWVRIIQNDINLITSSWAYGTVGQVMKIKEIDTIQNKISFESAFRIDFSLSRNPIIIKHQPAENVAVECLKIKRVDNTSPLQTSNIYVDAAINCRVSNIESDKCNFCHISVDKSSNIEVSNSYFHHSFEYGTGGRGYGIALQYSSNECLVQNNVFERLRHSMLVQAGANGNVFAYNYSHDPFWNSIPSDAAGDIVLHGNYVFANLFEQNICQNIVIDNSHGPNGPFNTFFRNRAEKYGIFFEASNSPGQNFVGNEIPNTALPYSLFNYNILGNDQFLFGNNNKGTIDPAGTGNISESSLFITSLPNFLSPSQFGKIGPPASLNSSSIPVYDIFYQNLQSLFDCDKYLAFETSLTRSQIAVFPNPTSSDIHLKSPHPIESYIIRDINGKLMTKSTQYKKSIEIDTENWTPGMYLLQIRNTKGEYIHKKIIKQ